MASADIDNIDISAQALAAVVQNSDNARTDVTQGPHSHGDAVDAALNHPDAPDGASHIGARPGVGRHLRRFLGAAYRREDAAETADGEADSEGEEAHNAAKTVKASRRHSWLEQLVPGVEKLTVTFHAGNFVALRDTTKPPGSIKVFESMPIYARIGMHLLFCGREQTKFLESGKLERILKDKSVEQGKIYDAAASAASIPSFISTYALDLSELLEPNPTKYTTFNEFFHRKLRPGARSVENTAPNAVCSSADCRLTVYGDVGTAQKFWIKGDEFTLASLLHGKPGHKKSTSAHNGADSHSHTAPVEDAPATAPANGVDTDAPTTAVNATTIDRSATIVPTTTDDSGAKGTTNASEGPQAATAINKSHWTYDTASFPIDDAALAIFRLAPADYHRFHSPVGGEVVAGPVDIDGTYYTVNPQAVNEVDFDVFTANKRSVLYLRVDQPNSVPTQPLVVAFVAIGALLVGAIRWSKKAGERVERGEELGYFAYGGSTCIIVFPKGSIKFDDDLLENSLRSLETMVKVGSSLGVLA